MHESLHLDVRSLAHLGDLADAELAADDDALAPELARELRALGARDAHLRRAVDGEVGGGAADERDEADVLDDDRVHARARDRAHQALRLSKLLVEHEDVHRDVAADAALVQERDDVGELLDVEIRRPGARVEEVQAEVHRVRARLHRRAHLRPTPGGG